ncbi:MAG: hypothetical protein AAF393_06740 [Pseudomonadota bacterium]
MHRKDIKLIRAVLPAHETFHYFPDREAVWLLAQWMPEAAPVRELRQTSFGRLLERPSVRPLVAKSGGILRRPEVLALARGDWRKDGVAEIAWGQGARFFDRTLAPWGTGKNDYGWAQISRPGGNLVLQVNFPAEHQALFHHHLPREARKDLELPLHPVQRTGLPTMAWVRMDICLQTGTALIEEVQSDWFRTLSWRIEALRRAKTRRREMRTFADYQSRVLTTYGKDWPRATMLAALILLREELGIRDVWMHQAWSGPVLKIIPGTPPPVSLYTALPKAFCFEPTIDPPPFLLAPARKNLRRLRRDKRPEFWRLRFS